MDGTQKEKNLELERLVFFSDAVVAIAITLLALDLKIEKETQGQLTFADIAHSWKKFTAFFLSFLMIAIFWKIHHQFFFYIKKINDRLLFYNLGWLLFIVALPFSTTLISIDFFNTPAVFVYSLNIFIITCFQNAIWDHASANPEFLKDNITEEINRQYKVACNLAMGNGILAMALAFIGPVYAFIILLTRTLTFRLSAIRYIIKKTETDKKKQEIIKRKK